MQAFLHHRPVKEEDVYRIFELEVRVGNEVFWSRVEVSKVEYASHPRASSVIKRELVDKFIQQLKHDIYENIGNV